MNKRKRSISPTIRISDAFVEFVKAKRLEMNISQVELERQLEEVSNNVCPKKCVSLIETGASKKVYTWLIQALSKVTNTPEDEIISLCKQHKKPSWQDGEGNKLILSSGNTLAENIAILLAKRYEPAFKQIINKRAEEIAAQIENDSWVTQALAGVEIWQGRLEKPGSVEGLEHSN